MADTKVEVAEKQEVIKADSPENLKKETALNADYSKGFYASSDNFRMALNMANTLCKSNIIPQTFQNNPANCMIALEQAQRLDMSPLLVMQNLYVIQGKPSWSSSFLVALINASGKFDTELQYEETTDEKGEPYSCLVWTTKDGRRVEGMKITMKMAEKEGWLNKSGSKWRTIPQLMLRYRAVSFFARLNCPELTLGLYTSDEIMDNDMGTKKASKKSKLNSVINNETEEVIIDAEVVE